MLAFWSDIWPDIGSRFPSVKMAYRLGNFSLGFVYSFFQSTGRKVIQAAGSLGYITQGLGTYHRYIGLGEGDYAGSKRKRIRPDPRLRKRIRCRRRIVSQPASSGLIYDRFHVLQNVKTPGKGGRTLRSLGTQWLCGVAKLKVLPLSTRRPQKSLYLLFLGV